MARRSKGLLSLKTGVVILLLLALLYLAMHCKQYLKKEGFDGQKELVLVHMEDCPQIGRAHV